ncbi:MAG: hypothetical protein OHK0013_38030 [Sandaracinaceae bacterium]
MSEPRVGALVAQKYELMALLGQGGMGRVFQARHVVTGRLVAVKMVRSDGARPEEVRRRFEREARAIGRIEHPHVVEVLDAGIDDATSSPYIVQTLLRGVSLRDYLTARGRIEPILAARIVAPILRGLDAAHAGVAAMLIMQHA